MLRLIDGIFFKSKQSDDWTLRLHDLGHGHREAVIGRHEVWEEMHRATADEQALWDLNRELDADARHLANLKRSARRAKTKVRRMVKVLGLDALLTLTYRENQTDLPLCKAHMKEFIRRVRKLLPGFVYVAAFEQQKRGAWHVHMAVHKLPTVLAWSGTKVKSYNVIRAVWRSVVGDLGGNIDQQRRRKFSRQSSAKLAAYLSKYMLKAFEDGDDWSNRYSGSAGVVIPPAQVLRFQAAKLAELIDLAYGVVAVGACQVSTWLSRYGDAFFISTEDGAGWQEPPI